MNKRFVEGYFLINSSMRIIIPHEKLLFLF